MATRPPASHHPQPAKLLRFLFFGTAGLVTVFLCYKMASLYAYYVKYSAANLAPGPIRTCDECATNTSNIPRILHQSWKNSSVPSVWQASYQSCLDAHENYLHYLWTDSDMDNFIQKEYPWFHSTFVSYQYDIQRADAARYFILYHYGGVYVDLDIGCKMPTHKMLDYKIGYKVIIAEGYPMGLTNWFMATVPKHRLFFNAINRLKQAKGVYGTPYLSTIWSTGPMFLTKCAVVTPECKTELLILPFEDLFRMYFWKAPGGSWHKPDAVFFLLLRDLGMNWRIIFCVFSSCASLLLFALCVFKRRRLSPCFYRELKEIGQSREACFGMRNKI